MLKPVYTLDMPISNLFDVNGTPVGEPQLHHVYAAAANHPELGKKLFTPASGIFEPQELEDAIKNYTPVVPVVKPGQVATLTKGAVTANSIAANWKAPTTGDPVDHYTVDITPAISGYPKNVSVLTNTFTGLTAATAYTIKVKAVNTGGSSANKTLAVTTADASKASTPPIKP